MPKTADHEEREERRDEGGGSWEAAEAYAQRCQRLNLPLEPTIAVWLRFGGATLQVPSHSSLLPACDFLAQGQGLKALSFRSAGFAARGTGNANARVLRHVLAKNTTLETLDLAHSGEIGEITS
ncbi:Uncharacterized protein SCF082_LOCUS39400 [Durusdinium trenchii]|uniref:Uncharacterized protein n=1 Tax=Durusdinium trenchii TaxID=1381693 RepID=A0ABP0Q3W9_9DINO